VFFQFELANASSSFQSLIRLKNLYLILTMLIKKISY